MRHRAITATLLTAALFVGAEQQAAAQDSRDDLGRRQIDDLPRPGYEAKRIRLGQTVISPEVRIGAEYDSNVFATSQNADTDMLFTVAPTIGIQRDTGKLKLTGTLFGTLRQYLDNKREGVDTFGATAETRYSPVNGHIINASIDAQRAFERRTDPESPNDPARPPAKINVGKAELGYQYRPGRFGFAVRGTAEKFNYLPAEEADRDMTSWRGSARFTARISPRFDAFAEAFVNRRNARLRLDRGGFDRDNTTKGILAGVASELSQRLQGEIGIGLFRSNPDDPTLKSFTGFAANGNLTWRPRIRTAVTASIFRGDVATIRAGANGRVDTRASVRVDQEVRHNLVLSGALAVRDTSYRGSINRGQRLASVELEAGYLVSRHIQLVATTSFAKRTANQPLDRFERFRFGIATRLIY